MGFGHVKCVIEMETEGNSLKFKAKIMTPRLSQLSSVIFEVTKGYKG